MTELAHEVVAFAATLESQRKQMLHQVSKVLSPPGALPITEQFDAVPRLSALLAASLEELKVAEEELSQQQETISAGHVRLEQQLNYFRMLFDFAPTPTIVTDLNAAIRDANVAACALLKRDARLLSRKPLAALVPRDERAAFRTALARLAITQGATDWALTLDRQTDVPVSVRASVVLVPDRTIGSGALLWQLYPATNPAAR